MSNINNLNKNAFRSLQAASRSNPKEVTAKEANFIKKGILADKKVDASEQKLLDALTKDGKPNLTVGAQKTATFSPSDLSFNRTVTDSAKKVLNDIKSIKSTEPLENMWNDGPKGLKKMVDMYKGSVDGKTKVTQFLKTKLDSAWKESSWKDGYQNLRGLVAKGYGDISKLEGQDYNIGKQMFYEGILAADKGVDGSTTGGIPDFVYNWLKPE